MPICFYEAKQSLLCETYLKNYRKERVLLMINLSSMILSCVLGGIIVFLFKSLLASVFLILFMLVIRSTFSEVYLSNYLKISIMPNFIIEILLTLVFIISANTRNIAGLIVYLTIYIIYFLFNKKDIFAIMARRE